MAAGLTNALFCVCRVDERFAIKIADFGLSRDIFHGDYYRMQSLDQPLPVRWMAYESITERLFTQKTDVVGDVTGRDIGGVAGDVTGGVASGIAGVAAGGVAGGVTGDVTGRDIGGVTSGVSGGVAGGVAGGVTGVVALSDQHCSVITPL